MHGEAHGGVFNGENAGYEEDESELQRSTNSFQASGHGINSRETKRQQVKNHGVS